jgi:riboflavin synthase
VDPAWPGRSPHGLPAGSLEVDGLTLKTAMFTGLIEAKGRIRSLEPRPGTTRIAIETEELAGQLREGDSIAVNGVCLTALDIAPPVFYADLAAETLARTTLGGMTPGRVVSLELPTRAGTPLGGHIVQGHVDATGTLLALEAVDPAANPSETDWWLRIEVPEAVGQFVVEKGSIAVDGISLTVARWDGHVLTIAIIPHTYAATHLHTLTVGDKVNLEADVLMKLAVQQQRPKPHKPELTLASLIGQGY